MARLCERIDGVAVEMQKDVPHVGVVKTGCQGLCELGPLDENRTVRLSVCTCTGGRLQRDRRENCICKVQPVESLFYRIMTTVCPHPDDIPFLNQQTRIVLENCGKIDAESIDEYIAVGGYQALAKVVGGMTPQEVIDEVTQVWSSRSWRCWFPSRKEMVTGCTPGGKNPLCSM